MPFLFVFVCLEETEAVFSDFHCLLILYLILLETRRENVPKAVYSLLQKADGSMWLNH